MNYRRIILYIQDGPQRSTITITTDQQLNFTHVSGLLQIILTFLFT